MAKPRKTKRRARKSAGRKDPRRVRAGKKAARTRKRKHLIRSRAAKKAIKKRKRWPNGRLRNPRGKGRAKRSAKRGMAKRSAKRGAARRGGGGVIARVGRLEKRVSAQGKVIARVDKEVKHLRTHGLRPRHAGIVGASMRKLPGKLRIVKGPSGSMMSAREEQALMNRYGNPRRGRRRRSY